MGFACGAVWSHLRRDACLASVCEMSNFQTNANVRRAMVASGWSMPFSAKVFRNCAVKGSSSQGFASRKTSANEGPCSSKQQEQFAWGFAMGRLQQLDHCASHFRQHPEGQISEGSRRTALREMLPQTTFIHQLLHLLRKRIFQPTRRGDLNPVLPLLGSSRPTAIRPGHWSPAVPPTRHQPAGGVQTSAFGGAPKMSSTA